MATNQLYPEARHITIPAPGQVKSGDPVVVGGIAGVAQTDAKDGDLVTLWLDGSYEIACMDTKAKVGDVVYAELDGARVLYGPGDNGRKVAPFGVVIRNKSVNSYVGLVEVVPFGIHSPAAVTSESES